MLSKVCKLLCLVSCRRLMDTKTFPTFNIGKSLLLNKTERHDKKANKQEWL